MKVFHYGWIRWIFFFWYPFWLKVILRANGLFFKKKKKILLCNDIEQASSTYAISALNCTWCFDRNGSSSYYLYTIIYLRVMIGCLQWAKYSLKKKINVRVLSNKWDQSSRRHVCAVEGLVLGYTGGAGRGDAERIEKRVGIKRISFDGDFFLLDFSEPRKIKLFFDGIELIDFSPNKLFITRYAPRGVKGAKKALIVFSRIFFSTWIFIYLCFCTRNNSKTKSCRNFSSCLCQNICISNA